MLPRKCRSAINLLYQGLWYQWGEEVSDVSPLGLQLLVCLVISKGKEVGVAGYGQVRNSLWDAKKQYPALLEGQSSLGLSKFRRRVCSSRGCGREVSLFSEQFFCCLASHDQCGGQQGNEHTR